jgi:hypothetical protein
MWEWNAGPRWRGVTDNEERARAHAESHLAVGETARVEKVVSSCGHSSPLGTDWTATCVEPGSIEWLPFRLASAIQS